MQRPLMTHQEEGVQYALPIAHPAFICAMRTGKTLIDIRWIQRLEYCNRNLIVAPLSVLESWKRELFLEGEPFFDLHDLSKLKRDAGLTDAWETRHRMWTLVNFDLVRILEEISWVPWDSVSVDESVVISNPSAKITRVMTKGFRDAKHRSILTGLPAPESELQLFTQFQFLHGSWMGCDNFWKWKYKYFQPSIMNPKSYEPKPGVRKIIKEEMQKISFIRRKKDVGMNNKKVFERRYVDMSSDLKKIYDSVVKDFAYQRADGSWNETQWVPTARLWMQRLAGGFEPTGETCVSTNKYKELLYLLTTELAQEPVVIWFKFRNEVRDCMKFLTKNRISAEYVTSEVSATDRERKRLLFMAGKCKCFLATEASFKRGKDLSVADVEIYYSNEWSTDARLQSEERIENPFKKASLLYIDLITRGTTDEDVVDGVRMKGFNAKDLLAKHVPILDLKKRR